jgi:hypothetical protein
VKPKPPKTSFIQRLRCGIGCASSMSDVVSPTRTPRARRAGEFDTF